MFRVFKIWFFALMLPLTSLATHNRAGEITYEHLGGNTYRATVKTCTKTSAPADRPELTNFDWGDGTIDTLQRALVVMTGPDHQENTYYGVHTYAGPGVYILKMYDPNRNSDILNIVNSVLEPFCLRSTLIISPATVFNNSVTFQECPCPEYACVFKRYCYHVGAVDPDGDSLVYSLEVPSGGTDCTPMSSNYVYPDAPINVGGLGGGAGVLTINSQTGTVCWDAPQRIGEFNFCVRVSEYRNGLLVGSVVRDIQLTVVNCSNNPPVLQTLPSLCVEAGATVNFPVSATDPDAGQLVTVTPYGSPFTFSPPNQANYNDNSPAPVINGFFNWVPGCGQVNNSPYQVSFEARDNGQPVELSDIKTAFIKVYAPPVQNFTVTPLGNTIQLSWSPSACSNVIGYRIYRKLGNPTLVADSCCAQGLPQTMGFIEIAQTVGWNSTTFIDNSEFQLGVEYCYLVVALFNQNTESCISTVECAQLRFDVPILTHVTIDVTNNTTGTDTVIWSMPKELDTLVQFSGSYYYNLYRSAGMGITPVTLVHTTPISTSLALTDTIFFDSGLNTSANPYTYKVELVFVDGAGVEYNLGGGSTASSVFLNSAPTDNAVILTWNSIVPWIEYQYDIFREIPTGSGVWVQVGTTTLKTFTDTGLVNGQTYCYRVKAIGTYNNAQVVDPLINWSQVKCETPWDNVAPCSPALDILTECEATDNQLIWSNPNNNCADDVMSYNVYFSAGDTTDFQLIATISSSNDTTWLHNNLGSLAGCYYVTAIDSAQYGNESVASNIMCADNCPYYWLPNVFTPNNDGANDRFVPFPYRHVASVHMQIFNRWGTLVFETTDPDINWDGTNIENGEPLSEGTYFYVCNVNTIRLWGNETITLKGFVQLLAGPKFGGN